MINFSKFTPFIPFTRLMEWDLEWIKTEKEPIGFIFYKPIVFSKEERVENLKKYDVGF